jgi:hypothetical protein
MDGKSGHGRPNSLIMGAMTGFQELAKCALSLRASGCESPYPDRRHHTESQYDSGIEERGAIPAAIHKHAKQNPRALANGLNCAPR